MEIVSATSVQDSKGVATLFSKLAVPRKKHQKVSDVTKNKGVSMMQTMRKPNFLKQPLKNFNIWIVSYHANNLIVGYWLENPFDIQRNLRG